MARALKRKYDALMKTEIIPTEFAEQKIVINALEKIGICYSATANGGNRNVVTGAMLKASGVKKGLPDILIFDPPPAFPGKVGLAIEMKRIKGGSVSEEQTEWIRKLQARGWVAVVCKGAEVALDELDRAGYISGKGPKFTDIVRSGKFPPIAY